MEGDWVNVYPVPFWLFGQLTLVDSFRILQVATSNGRGENPDD